MTDYDVFPDAEYLAIRILKDDVTDVFGPLTPRIGPRLPDDPDYSLGVITVNRIGGVPTERHRLDHANIQIDTWAETKALAHDLAQLARVVMHRAEGKVYTTPPAVLTGVEDSLGLTWQFDTLNLKPRYSLGLYLTVHLP